MNAEDTGTQAVATASAKPRSIPVFLTSPQSLLTIFCGIFLALAFVPKWDVVAFASIVAGSYYALKAAGEAIRDRKLDVNILMVLAAIGAIVVGQERDAAALLFLFSLSSTLESYAMAKTKAAIEKLVQLRPTTAILVKDGQEERVPVESLKVGDLVRVTSFEKLPIDGEIASGMSSIDESALTGESLPVSKKPGDGVVAGTQNLEGTLFVTVAKEVGNSTLDQIIEMVQRAQENKASGEKISEWFGERYTLFVIVAFVVAWVARYLLGQTAGESFYSALILLVALSPCALVISTPASTLSALTKAARRGILVRGGEYIERAAEIDIVAMDKTGTLTKGDLQLASFALQSGTSASFELWSPGLPVPPSCATALSAIASVEEHSTHPIGRAIVRAALVAGVGIPSAVDCVTTPGIGLNGTVDGRSWIVGNAKVLAQNRMEGQLSINTLVSKSESEGKSSVYAIGPDCIVFMSFGDTVREEAKEAVQAMRDVGVKRVVMLTGDRQETARSIAAMTKVDEFHAGLMPADKTELVGKMQKEGHVMMVGDGVNDAPSLALSTLGVAMGSLGSDVAIEAADVVLMQDDLRRIPELIKLGRRTRGIIRANLAFACGMILTLAITSLVTKLPLPIAVLGHEGSTVLVILNGLRLLK